MRLARSIPGLVLVGLLTAARAGAQSVGVVTVNGTVVDAGSSLPLAGAQLTLAAPGSHSVFPPVGSSPSLTAARLAVTDSLGRYEMRGVPAGEYQLLIKRLGYQPSIMNVELIEGSGSAKLSVGLVVVPVRLRPVQVHSNELNLFGSPSNGGASSMSPIDVARARHARFLGTDVRELSAVGALEGGALGETDIFRAMRRMPGVTGTGDDLADLWIRGGRWDQVRVSYDGMPIFNPFRSGGRLSGIGADGIGAVFLHPGVRPVSLLNQGASLLDIRSRAATDSGFHAAAEASFNGLSSLLQLGSASGDAGATFTARRSFTGPIGTGFQIYSPYNRNTQFSELAFRADKRFVTNAVEVSLLRAKDYLYGSGTESFLGRLTYTESRWGWRHAQTIGFSSYESSSEQPRHPWLTTRLWLPDAMYPIAYPTATRRGSVSYFTIRGHLTPVDSSTRPRWSVGHDVSLYRARSDGPRHRIFWGDTSSQSYHFNRPFLLGSLWAERRFSPTSRLTVDAGVRVEGSIGFRSNDDTTEATTRLAPTVQARYALTGRTAASIGVSRSFQDIQELSPAGPFVSPGQGLWLTTGKDVPRLGADQASAGISHWLGQSLLLDANVYVRRLTGIAFQTLLPVDSEPGPGFRPGSTIARGLELSARKLTGRLTGSIGYTWGKSVDKVDASEFPGSGDRRHSFDAASMLRLGKFRLGAGYTYMTGAPFTRLYVGRVVPIGEEVVEWEEFPGSDRRNAERLPEFSSLDLFADWQGRLRKLDITPFLGIRNATDHDNETAAAVYPRGASAEAERASGNYIGSTFPRQLNLGIRIVF